MQKNLNRARFSLPFLDPVPRDLITLIPALFAEGKPSIGIYEHPTCTPTEVELLKKYLGRRPDIRSGRTPYRVSVESVIVLVRPSLANRYFSSITIVCIARRDGSADDLSSKISAIGEVFKAHGIPFSGLVYTEPLPQSLVYEILRTGIVVGGKEPVTGSEAVSESCVYIGNLPGKITESFSFPREEWNPFQCFLAGQIAEFIEGNDYPSAVSIPSGSPFIVPYLHILHRHEERGDTEKVEKMRMSLFYLLSCFPPAKEAMESLMSRWKTRNPYPPLKDLGIMESFRLRRWLVPLQKNELPIFSWPPLPQFSIERAALQMDDYLWGIQSFGEFRHKYAWVVLIWASLAGLIGTHTRIAAPDALMLKRACKGQLLEALNAIRKGADILVPEDHRHGSIQIKDGRPFFSSEPFAILERGSKHSVELFEVVKKKTLIDDSGL